MSNFIDLQNAFAAHLREPAKNPAPLEIEHRRMAIYRDLFFNNIEGLLSSVFPVMLKIIRREKWLLMVRRFYADHPCESPIFSDISKEFVEYLQTERKPEKSDPAFMVELAHYEWVEMALSISQDDFELEGVEHYGDIIEHVPVLSPLAWPLSYSFEVHKIGPKYQPTEPSEQPTLLIVYRDRNDKVGFMEANAVTMRLVQMIGENQVSESPKSGRQILEAIAAEMQHPQPEVVIAGGVQIFTQLRDRDIIAGAHYG